MVGAALALDRVEGVEGLVAMFAETTALLRACGDVVLRCVTGANANDLIIVGVR